MLDTGSLHPDLADLDGTVIHGILKFLTIRFHLRNKAEQVHIARVNRQRERQATTDAPRSESIAEAVGSLVGDGIALARLLETLTSIGAFRAP